MKQIKNPVGDGGDRTQRTRVSPEGKRAVVSGLTPFGTSAAHSACRVGARMLFSSIPGVALAVGSLYPGLPAVAPPGLKNSANLRFAGKTMEACERTRAAFPSPRMGAK